MEAFGRGNYCSRVVLVTANSNDDHRLIIMKSKKDGVPRADINKAVFLRYKKKTRNKSTPNGETL